MKVGIVTLSASDNCGSLLQAYALQTILKTRYKADVEIVDFRCKASNDVYSVIPRNPLKQRRRFLNGLCNFNTIKRQKEDYEQFRRKQLHMSAARFRSLEELESKNIQYDVLMCGSDQIWNIHISDFDMAYFLQWGQASKRIAYAPSLGGSDFSGFSNKEMLRKILEGFDGLSVREETGKTAIEKYCNRDVSVVADPTLLVDSKTWQCLPASPLVKEPYIFYYSWSYNSDNLNRVVQEYAQKMNLPVYVINAFKWVKYKPKHYGFQMFPNSGPEVFLNLMKYAQYVFVQSFHGVIFAHQMRKDFWLLDDNPPEKMDKRLKSIVSLLEKEDRVVRDIKDIDMANSRCSYHSDFKKLENLRNNSFSFLDEGLKEE